MTSAALRAESVMDYCSHDRKNYCSAGLEHRDWQLWAHFNRQPAGSELGYPRQEPWYLPPRGFAEHTDRDALGAITPTDEWVAHQIGISVFRLAQIRPKQALALAVHWKAFPGAKKQLDTNCKQAGVNRQYVYECRDTAMRWVEADIEFRLGLNAPLRVWHRQLG